jgi:hypothetical protein
MTLQTSFSTARRQRREMMPVGGRSDVSAKEVNTPALPRFDHAAMDGYGYPASVAGSRRST